MSLLSRAGLIRRVRRGKSARARLVASNLDKGVAFQIRATRESRPCTQAELAAAAGMGQNNVSRLEDPEYGKYTISSLKRIAEALDVALVVRFVPFTQYVDWLSGTPYLDKGLDPAALTVPSFDEEDNQGKYETRSMFYEVLQTIPATGSVSVGLISPSSTQRSMNVVEAVKGYQARAFIPGLKVG